MMLQPVAHPGSAGPTTSQSQQVLDEEGQQYLQVQEHAAAVQLLNRSLAVAHLRAELVKPRGRAVALKPKEPTIKQEPGTATPSGVQQQQQQAQVQIWQRPQQPMQPSAAVAEQRAIAIALGSEVQQTLAPDAATSTQQQQQQHEGRRRALPNTRRHLHRAPDPAAAAKWLQGEANAPGDAGEEGDISSVIGQRRRAGLAPRIVADPVLQAQQLAGWLRVGADGAAAAAGAMAAGEDGGVAGEQQDMHTQGAAGGVQEEMAGGGAAGAAGAQEQQQPLAEDFMDDEEEWI